MIVVNLFGGPGVGKSTIAAMLFAHYKRRGVKTELAREAAKELFYQGRPLARNQMLMLGMQYQALKDFEAAGTRLVISDSPLRLGCVYASLTFSRRTYDAFAALTEELNADFQCVDVLVKRAVTFQAHGREQGEESAREIDGQITGPFNLVCESPAPGDILPQLDALLLPEL